jgi:hypothetical protein
MCVGTAISKKLEKTFVPTTDMCEKGELGITWPPIRLKAVRKAIITTGGLTKSNESPV